MTAGLDSKYLRAYGIVTDAYGVDPLRDTIIPLLVAIPTYTYHSVSSDERGALDLISFKEYGTEDFWWHIQFYNGIARWKDVVEGMTLKIPDYGAILAIISYADISSNQ